jgi:hypothetical protein
MVQWQIRDAAWRAGKISNSGHGENNISEKKAWHQNSINKSAYGAGGMAWRKNKKYDLFFLLHALLFFLRGRRRRETSSEHRWGHSCGERDRSSGISGISAAGKIS